MVIFFCEVIVIVASQGGSASVVRAKGCLLGMRGVFSCPIEILEIIKSVSYLIYLNHNWKRAASCELLAIELGRYLTRQM